MKWEDTGVVLSLRKFSERDAIVSVLTKRHGIWRAIVKGALSRQARANYEPGNLLLVRWNARLSEHMGNFTCELLEQQAARLMQERSALCALMSASALLEGCIEERDPHPLLFDELRRLIEMQDVWGGYLRYERILLAEAGYGLDLASCAATGGVQELIYISPASGRAVCREAGAPYHERMLPMPRAFREENLSPKPAEILDALRVTGYFFLHRLYAPQGRHLPLARERLMEVLEKECLVC